MNEVDDVVARFELGQADGLDPQPAADEMGSDGTATTNASSWWTGLVCDSCRHTFRLGDRVRSVPGLRTPTHLDPALKCGIVDSSVALTAAPPDDRQDAATFAAALVAAWPPLHGVPVARLEPRDWRIPKPGQAHRSPVCLYCAHTFRPGEHVVICPCLPSGLVDPATGGCGSTVHRDPAAGLPCWESWCPSGLVEICPVRLTRTDGAVPAPSPGGRS